MSDESPYHGMTLRDYVNGDAEDNIDQLLPLVYDRLHADHIEAGNFRHSWDIDPVRGIEELAWLTSQWCESGYEIDLIEVLRDRNDPQQPAAIGFVRSVYGCVQRLIDEGMVEVVIDGNWPTIHLTMKGVNFRDYYFPGPAADRAKQARDRIALLRSMPYADYLQSEEWRYRREIHIEAAGFRCQLCNSGEQPLHVHHRTYANRGRENFYDLVALCGICHQNFHNSGRKVR